MNDITFSDDLRKEEHMRAIGPRLESLFRPPTREEIVIAKEDFAKKYGKRKLAMISIYKNTFSIEKP